MATVDFRSMFQSGHTTLREQEARPFSIRVVFAGYEAAQNAGINLADYLLMGGNGVNTGVWTAWTHGAMDKQVVQDQLGRPVLGYVYIPADPQRVASFVRHWKRLTSRHDFKLVVKDAVTERTLAEV